MTVLATAAALAVAVLALVAPMRAAAQPPADEPDASAAWSLALSSRWHSDALTLAQMGSSDQRPLAPRPGRNLAYVDDEARLSRSQGGWTWSLLARSYATLVASPESLQLIALQANRRQPEGDTRWPADLRLRALTGAGLAVGRASALGAGWQGHGELQLLRLSRWQQRDIRGQVSFSRASAQYSLDLQSDELNSRLRFPYRDPYADAGTALLLAAGLDWTGAHAWARITIRDGGWLAWSGVPQQQQTLNSATQGVDADGFLVYRPLLQGLDSQSRRRVWWPWRASVAAGARLADGQRLGLRLDTIPAFGVLPVLQWQGPAEAADRPALRAEWRLHERRLGVGVSWQGLALAAGADRLGSAQRSRELALSYTRAF